MTVNEYYDNHVKGILTNVMNSLESNKERKFNHAEMMFFAKWWQDQDDQKKD